MVEEGLLKEKLGDSLEAKISEKQKAFSGLLTREGALKLIALDEGVAQQGNAKANDILPLAQALSQNDAFASVLVRVKQVYCAREFDKEGRQGKCLEPRSGRRFGAKNAGLLGEERGHSEFLEGRRRAESGRNCTQERGVARVVDDAFDCPRQKAQFEGIGVQALCFVGGE